MVSSNYTAFCSGADPPHVAFYDDKWGVPVHDDKKLFELRSLSGVLAEMTRLVILIKRDIFREVFLDFDEVAVAKLNEKKISSAGTAASSLLSEPKLRTIIESARQICKLETGNLFYIIEEFGSFDEYIWNFMSHKPIVSQFWYSRQVPVKTRKVEVISTDLECLIGTELSEKDDSHEARATKKPENAIDAAISAALSDPSLSQ